MQRWTRDGHPPTAAAVPVPGLILDRDGTLTEERGYLADPDALVACDGAVEAVARARAAGLPIAVVTNQAGVGRGLIPPEALPAMHARLAELFDGVEVVYCCPHHPDDGCACRKPSGAMPAAAVRDLGLDPARTLLVGDHLTDCLAGRAAGVQAVLVATGHGHEHADEAREAGFVVVPDIATAIDLHLERLNTRRH